MTLPRFLQEAGYRQVPLDRNGVGHFEVAGVLSGRPVRVLIDTGASSTVIDVALARKMGLDLVPAATTGGGAGGADLEVFEIRGAELRVAGTSLRPKALYAIDLTHVNAALAQRGASAADAVLGVDVFDAQKAVIDYSSSSLFLREARDPDV